MNVSTSPFPGEHDDDADVDSNEADDADDDDKKEGMIFLCDADEISETNLHRQFLFGEEDVGASKAITATHHIQHYFNPSLQISAFNSEISLSSLLSTFTEETVWRKGIDQIISAVDTVAARQTLDLISRGYNVPFLESGTAGNSCNCRQYLPLYTSRFEVPNTDIENEINCLGKQYPFRPRHTISFAKSDFLFFFSTLIHLFNDTLLSSSSSPSLSNDNNDVTIDDNKHAGDSDIGSGGDSGDHEVEAWSGKEAEQKIQKIMFSYLKSLIQLITSSSSSSSSSSDEEKQKLKSLKYDISTFMFEVFYIKKVNYILSKHPPHSHDEHGGSFSPSPPSPTPYPPLFLFFLS